MASIKNLETSVNAIATKLTNNGFKCEVSSFKGGGYTGISSYVELEIEKDGGWGAYQFFANGVDVIGNNKYGGNSVKEMIARFNIDLNKTFEL